MEEPPPLPTAVSPGPADLEAVFQARGEMAPLSHPELAASLEKSILGQCEPSGTEPVNIVVEERASLDNIQACGNSSLEPKDPGKKRVYMFLEMAETATLSLTSTERGDQSS
ncbi:unnamed protein product [Coccothraustes coccothraustes]